jgi:hypothetical protein
MHLGTLAARRAVSFAVLLALAALVWLLTREAGVVSDLRRNGIDVPPRVERAHGDLREDDLPPSPAFVRRAGLTSSEVRNLLGFSPPPDATVRSVDGPDPTVAVSWTVPETEAAATWRRLGFGAPPQAHHFPLPAHVAASFGVARSSARGSAGLSEERAGRLRQAVVVNAGPGARRFIAVAIATR